MATYAAQKNVQILVALLKSHNVRHAVLSPGSRNMPLVRSLETDPFFTTYSVVDERSAAYFAIGISLAQNAPVLLSCTSAQATRNYIPGLTEAYYRGSPIIAVTADYRQSKIGQGVMQALDQMSIPRDSAKISVQLPLVHDAEDEEHCARLVNEALLGLWHHGPGPVHIDLPIESPWVGGVTELPKVKTIERHALSESLPDLVGKKVLVMVGQHAPFTDRQQEALDRFSETYDTVVYTNQLSNYFGPKSVPATLLVENIDTPTFVTYAPDVLITIGGQPGDYGIDAKLRSGTYEHWRVNKDGRIEDTYGRLTRVFECSEEDFFNAYSELAPRRTSSNYYDKWAAGTARRSIPANIPLSHAHVAATLSPVIPSGSTVHFGILSALRNWNYFRLNEGVAGYSNVAAFGIDGGLSTFIGHSVASASLCFLIIGDLSFFYDMNVIGNRHVKSNARVILVNNNGGGEFRLYAHAANQFGDEADVHIAAAGHHGSARGWVESMGWDYIEVRAKQDLLDARERFIGASDRPILMEVFTTMHDDSEGVRLIRAANTVQSLKRRVGNRLPPPAKRAARWLLRR